MSDEKNFLDDVFLKDLSRDHFDLTLIPSQMVQFKKRLKPEGIAHLRSIRDWYGDGNKLNVVFKYPVSHLPHPVHFREGMHIRNILRDITMRTWTDEQYDDNWERITLEAIS